MKIAPQLRGYSEAELADLCRRGLVHFDDDVLVPTVSGAVAAWPIVNNCETSSGNVTPANSGGANADALDAQTVTSPATMTYDTTAGTFMHGTAAWKYAIGASLTTVFGSYTLPTTVATIYGGFYFRPGAAAGSTVRLIRFMNGATTLAVLGYASGTNNMQWRTSADAGITGGTGALTVNTYYRVEFDITLGSTTTGAANLTLYAGDSLTANSTHNVTAQNFGASNCNTIQVGNTGANYVINNSFWIDSINFNITGRPGVGPYAKSAAVPVRKPVIVGQSVMRGLSRCSGLFVSAEWKRKLVTAEAC